MQSPRILDEQALAVRQALPTMYTLPSESAEEPGLPDEFHGLQPQLLSATFRPPDYPRGEIFTGTDLNLYYDANHTQWYKRPDWFAVVGVPRLYGGTDLRLSYVVWQEQVNPAVVVELISPGTEQEDLGQTERREGQPPTKWQVYEQILQVPNYIVYDRYIQTLRAFCLKNGRYQERQLTATRVWLAELNLGLGLWRGSYDQVPGNWLRWYDTESNWILTEAEQERQRAEQERQRVEQERLRAEAERLRADEEKQRADRERQRAEALAQRLRDLGLDP